jgi:signal transduction histidine kinase
MKIRNRLTFIYTVIVALILLALSVYVYSLIKLNFHKVFYEKLENRALITGKFFLEKDEVSAAKFNDFEKRYMQNMPGEKIRVYDSSNKPVFIDVTKTDGYPDELINQVRKENTIETDDGQRQVVGIKYEDNQGEFIILVSAEDELGKHSLAFTRNTILTGYVLSLVIVFISGRFLSKQALDPISDIVQNVNRIKASNLHLRLDEGNGKDEISELSITFNNMLERLENAFETEKNFIHNASHQLRTPLSSMIVELEVALTKERDTEEYKVLLVSVLAEAEKLGHMITGLLDLALINREDNDLMAGTVRLDELLWDLRDKISKEVPGSNIQISFANLPPDSEELTIHGNKSLLEIALYNLIENACKFSNNQEVSVNLLSANHGLTITIKDKGIGIPPDEISKVNKSFYRAKNASSYNGSGVGLALSEKIIRIHNGTLRMDSTLGEGTSMQVLFQV